MTTEYHVTNVTILWQTDRQVLTWGYMGLHRPLAVGISEKKAKVIAVSMYYSVCFDFEIDFWDDSCIVIFITLNNRTSRQFSPKVWAEVYLIAHPHLTSYVFNSYAIGGEPIAINWAQIEKRLSLKKKQTWEVKGHPDVTKFLSQNNWLAFYERERDR